MSPSQDKNNIAYGEPAPDYFIHLDAIMQNPHWHIAYWQAPWLVMKQGNPVRNESTLRTEIDHYIRKVNAPDR